MLNALLCVRQGLRIAAPNAGKVGAQRYDCHQQPLWDEEEQSYVLTTRTYPGSRAIGLLRGPPPPWLARLGGAGTSYAPEWRWAGAV